MKFLDISGLTSVLSKLLEKISVAYDGLEARVTANENAVDGKLDKKGGTIGDEEKWSIDSWGIQGSGNQTLNGFDSIEADTLNTDVLESEEIQPKNDVLTFWGDMCFRDTVDFE